MTTTTAFVSCPSGDWTLIADGASYSEVGIKADGATNIAVASSKPAADSGDYITLGCEEPILKLTLATGDNVYACPPRNTFGGGVRLYRVAAA